MASKTQTESTFDNRLRRINNNTAKRERKRGVTGRLPLTSIVIMGLFLIGVKALVLSSVSEGAYRQAALEMRQEGPVGVVLAVIFGPDPVSIEVSRLLRF
ncbi:MAG: hypothetical protein ACJA0F_002622 [Dinoroseobacter sp.]|jgi:hypothetical protein